MNPNNLIRPPRLIANDNPAPVAAAPPLNQNEPLNLNTLTEQITIIVSQVLAREGRHIINNILNPSSDINNDIDQIIDINANRDLSDLDKVPDIAKSLREFSGQPGEFSSWKKSVDRVLTIYDHLKGTPKYYGILSTIRNKIVGQADIALESYNTPLNWSKISKCLTLHYADKRDLGTLEYQMTTLVQGPNSIPEFYQVVYQHLSLILNKLSCMEMSKESLNNMTQSYRDKALDTFVRGLRGDLPRLLSIKEPVDLPQALHLCLKLQNVDFRTQYANNSQNSSRKAQLPPVLPPKPIPAPRRNFYPELLHNPQVQVRPTFERRLQPNPWPQYGQPSRPHYQNAIQQNSWPQNVHPMRPQYHRPQLPPKPMDIDQSIHSRQVNYANRPRIPQIQKRHHQGNSNQVHLPNKFQRIFNTEQDNNEQETEPSPDNCEGETYPENADNNQNTQTYEEYVEYYDNPHFDETEELDDIYFLD